MSVLLCPFCLDFDVLFAYTLVMKMSVNPNQLIEQAREAMINRPASGTGRWILIVSEGKIVTLPSNAYTRRTPIFFVFSEAQFKEGFSPHEWDLIGQRLFKYFLRKI